MTGLGWLSMIKQVSHSPARFGIEEEFFLCRADDHTIVRKPSRKFLRDCRNALGSLLSAELLQSQIEVRTAILETSAAANEALAACRDTLSNTAETHGLCILSAGTHPLAQWREQLASNAQRYRQIFEDFQIVAQRNLLCGLHVHVEVPAKLDRIHVMNGVMPWLPMFLSLSASSPYWGRRDTGLMSYRQSAYDEWPRTGIPRLFSGEAEYRRYIERMLAVEAIADESFIWWAIRPSARYPTLELRIADACPDIRDGLCIAQLYRAAVHQQILRLERGQGLQHDPVERLIIEENRWRAKRLGTKACLIPAGGSKAVELGQVVESFADECAEAIDELGIRQAVEHAMRLAREGCSAERQRRHYAVARDRGAAHHQALAEVVRELVRTTQLI